MPDYSSTQLGYFITYELWKDAVDLLNYQLERKKENKHFNRLSMFYYENLPSDQLHIIASQDYFNNFVANNFFYVLQEEFGIYPYSQPKQGLGRRNYVFLTYPMRCLFYAVGLYLVKLSIELKQEFISTAELLSFYGGNLFYDSDRLVKKPDTVYYKKHYNRFRNLILEAIENKTNNTFCLKIDIANYYDSIRVDVLLKNLENFVSKSKCDKLRFKIDTIEQIQFFFNYLSLGQVGIGIPQMDNGIVSDYIGYLYLLFGDLLIHEILLDFETSQRVLEFKIFRYVDDIYLFITTPNVSDSDRDSLGRFIGNRIADTLDRKLGLKCNTKSGIFRLNRTDELEELVSNLKRVSPDETVPDDDDPRPIPERADAVLSELNRINVSEVSTDFSFRYKSGDLNLPISSEPLKDIFAKPVEEIFKSTNYQTELSKVFRNFNFDLVHVYPASMVIIICLMESVVEQFEEYLLQFEVLTDKEVDLILRLLAQGEFTSRKLLDKLKQDGYMKKIIAIFESQNAIPETTGYFGISRNNIIKIREMNAVVQQVRLRRMSEKRHLYSTALNHLLNEIHGICYEINKIIDHSMTKSFKNYDANDVKKFLRDSRVRPTLVIQIGNLFDRRNNTTTSHTGSSDNSTSDVFGDEYSSYYKFVGDCLDSLLQ